MCEASTWQTFSLIVRRIYPLVVLRIASEARTVGNHHILNSVDSVYFYRDLTDSRILKRG
jgi:hypothetical protein